MVNINYHKRQSKKYPSPVEHKSTVKAKGPVCPLSNIRLGINDLRATTFLVNGQEVIVNHDAFIERCRKFGWKIPKLSVSDTLDADNFVLSVAKQFVDLEADLETQKQLESIRIFADLLGVKNFTSKLRRACRV